MEIATFLLKLLMELNFVNDRREIWRVCIFPPMVSSRYACFQDRVIVYTSSDRDSIFWNFIVGKETKLLLLSLPLLPPSYLAINPRYKAQTWSRSRHTLVKTCTADKCASVRGQFESRARITDLKVRRCCSCGRIKLDMNDVSRMMYVEICIKRFLRLKR